MKDKLRVSLRSIATKAMVSPMTVSLALRNDPRIKARTRDHVHKVARKMGYTPDPEVSFAMSRLRQSGHSKHVLKLAFITHSEKHWDWRDSPAIQAYYEGARRRALELGCELEEFSATDQGMTPERLSIILHTRAIRGLILAPLPETKFGNVLDFQWDIFTSIALNYSVGSPALHRVCSDNFRLMCQAYRELQTHGYNRIGIALSKDHDIRAGNFWSAGYLRMQNDSGAGQLAPFIPEQWKPASFARWIECEKPDVIVGIGTPLVEAINACGLRVPDDVGYAHLDLSPAHHGITGMRHSHHLIGRAAIDQLLLGLSRNELGVPSHPCSVLIAEGIWEHGDTIKSSV